MPTWYLAGNERFRGPVPASATAYQGPGDIVSGWAAWYGMRAFSASSAATGTQKAFKLKFNDTTQIDYFTQANGTVNLSTYAADLGTHGAPVAGVTWYDQSGNGRDLDLTVSAGVGPAFTLSALSGFPGFTFSGAQSGGSGGANITLTAPLSYSVVANVTGAATDQCFGVEVSPGATKCAFTTASGGVWYCYAGGATAEQLVTSSNAFHAAQFTLNGTSSHTYIDGVDSNLGASIGTAAFTATSLRVADDAFGTSKLTGVMVEFGLFNGSLFASQSALNSNQHGANGYSF